MNRTPFRKAELKKLTEHHRSRKSKENGGNKTVKSRKQDRGFGVIGTCCEISFSGVETVIIGYHMGGIPSRLGDENVSAQDWRVYLEVG